MAVGPLIIYPGFSVLQFAIIAFKGIGRILVFLVLLAIIACYSIGGILVFFGFAIIAFYSLGRILVFSLVFAIMLFKADAGYWFCIYF